MSTEVLEQSSPLGRYYASARGRIGHSTTVDLGVLERTSVQRYALAIGSTNPLHFDVAAAEAAGYDDVVAPENMLAAIFEWGPGTPESELDPDGTPPKQDGDTSELRGMGAGEEMELIAPATAGQHLFVDEALCDVVAKSTRSGPCVFVTTERTFRTDGGAVLNRNRRTVVLRNPHEGS